MSRDPAVPFVRAALELLNILDDTRGARADTRGSTAAIRAAEGWRCGQ